MRRLAMATIAVVLLLSARPAGAAERRAVTYLPPVAGPVTDPFRPPATPYGPGNRGIDYATHPGEVVRAAATGEVVFAGAVGNALHVVVLHADGIRTSYSFLRSVGVARGNQVGKGDVVGTAASSLHFGARAGTAYIDPAVLLAGDTRVHLIPDGSATSATPPTPAGEAAERAGLVRLVWGGVASGGRGAAKLAGASVAAADHVPIVSQQVDRVRQVRDALVDVRDLPRGARPQIPGEGAIRAAIELAQRAAGRVDCTPQDTAPPPPPTERHLVVLVGGLGSASGHASVLDVDTASLGYRPEDVMQFSYNGGTTADHPYSPEDTLTDLRTSGRRLRDLLERLQYEQPGVPVDLIAHSQGGLVARSALGNELDPFDPRTPRIGTLITLGTPHHGTDGATAAAMLRHTTYGPLVRTAAGRAGRSRGLDPRGKSLRQMAETSDYIRDLNRRPLPKGLRAVSIAARRDVVVPSPRSHLRGARNAIVTLPGIHNDHTALPGSVAAHREMALALAGRPPTCEDAGDTAADMLTGRLIDGAERAATGAALKAAQG